MTCKQKFKLGASQLQNREALVEAAKWLFTRMKKGRLKIDGKELPMNGEIAMLFKDDTLSSTDKALLRSYLNTTSTADATGFADKSIEIVWGEPG